MTTYTITLTDEQDSAVDTIVTAQNALEGATQITKKEFVQVRATELADAAVHEAEVYQASLVSEAYKNADTATKARMKNDLGI